MYTQINRSRIITVLISDFESLWASLSLFQPLSANLSGQGKDMAA